MTPRLKLRVIRPPAGRKRAGFTVSEAFVSDVARLSSGNACTLLLLALWARSSGDNQRRHDWTRALAVRDLAQICRCHVRTIQRELAALDNRGLLEIRCLARGRIEARLKCGDWEALPDYKSGTARLPFIWRGGFLA
jgi:hypothetical protein